MPIWYKKGKKEIQINNKKSDRGKANRYAATISSMPTLANMLKKQYISVRSLKKKQMEQMNVMKNCLTV